MTRLRVQCPNCHCLKVITEYDDKNKFHCQGCNTYFNSNIAPVYKDILIEDVKKDDVQHIEYSSGCFWTGYNHMLAYPTCDGKTIIRTKWTIERKDFSEPVILNNAIWGKMLDVLFDKGKFNTWKQEGYTGTYFDATDWHITLTLANNKSAYCSGICEGYPPEWTILNKYYEEVMAKAGATYFDKTKSDKIWYKLKAHNK